MLVVTDFPGNDGNVERLCFTDPIEIIVANDVRDVRAALERVERHAADGCFAVGFVTYDAAPGFDAALEVAERSAIPLVWFGIYDGPSVECNHDVAPRIDALDWQPHVERAQYEHAVQSIRNGIMDGAFYQVNHTVRLRAKWTGDTLAAYEALHLTQPSSYGMYLDIGQLQILSVSPELFFSLSGREIETRPMKGTTRRGRWNDEDVVAASTLATSTKDRAENVMIVDLVRSDLGRISKLGTVSVPRLFEVERHPTLWQMTSTITATLREDVRLADIFSALFPCGSVVGAPKIAAAEWIAAHESASRGLYCGAMGIVRPGGDCVFNVAIRTLVIDGATGIAEYGAGGAITIDSTPEGEYDELMTKAAVLRGAVPEFQLIETLRLSDGAFLRRERHLRRLRESADYFDFPDITDAFDSALTEQLRRNPSGDHRVRVLASRDGKVRTESAPIVSLDQSRDTSFRYAIARSPVRSLDPFLFHKTTRRGMYDERRAAHPGADEIVIVNERGELTECTIGNLVLEIDGQLYTPPRECGLLAGMFREKLLENGTILERVLYPSDLQTATTVWMINSLREWVRLYAL